MKILDVLVIDDEAGICEVVSDIMVKNGFTTKTALSAMEAEEILKESIPPLIICDISMPGKTGLEFVADLRAKGLPCAVVMLTAHQEPERILEALRLGCVDYITKPFKPKQLKEDSLIWIEMGRTLQGLCKGGGHLSELDKSLMKMDVLRAKANQIRKKAA